MWYFDADERARAKEKYLTGGIWHPNYTIKFPLLQVVSRLTISRVVCVSVCRCRRKRSKGWTWQTNRSQLVGSVRPSQTAIKCSVLRKWPIESMCVFYKLKKKQTFAWVCGRSMRVERKENKVIFVHFQQTWAAQQTLNVMTLYWKGLCVFLFVCFFISPLRWWTLNARAGIFRKSRQTGIKLSENLSLLHIGFCC